MIFPFPACVLAIRRNIGVALLAHLVLLLADPIFAFSFWMAVRALRTSQNQYAKQLHIGQQLLLTPMIGNCQRIWSCISVGQEAVSGVSARHQQADQKKLYLMHT